MKKNKELDKTLGRAKGFWNDFKAFIAKGNVFDLAIGIVIGAAFTGVVNSLVGDIITPMISFITGSLDFSNLFINLSGESYDTLAAAQAAGAPVITYGKFINALINFLIVSASIFFLIKWISSITKNFEKEQEVAPTPKTKKKCKFCLEEIKKDATKCMHCTADLV